MAQCQSKYDVYKIFSRSSSSAVEHVEFEQTNCMMCTAAADCQIINLILVDEVGKVSRLLISHYYRIVEKQTGNGDL